MDDIMHAFLTLEQLGVAHNDIIDRHILLTRNPDTKVENPNIVLIDFGQARDMSKVESVQDLRKYIAWSLHLMLDNDTKRARCWFEQIHSRRKHDPVWDNFLTDVRSIF